MPTKTTIAVACLTIMMAIPACDKDKEIDPARYESYYWKNGEKVQFWYRSGYLLYLLYHADDEDKIKEELEKVGIELGETTGYSDYSERLNTDMSGPGATRITNFKITIIRGDYSDPEKAASALSYTIYWAPIYIIQPREVYSQLDYILVKETFSVVLKPGTTPGRLEKLADKYAVEIIGRDNDDPDRYYLVCTNQSKGNALQMANLFHESGLFETTWFDHEAGFMF
ncbi:MAG: hypothetical protein LBK12_04515 [Odoribacteraceae bacterium]|jgi:hypothetical protein|nr:hypothetical protein [Odoribacteraceae bacterium]